MATVLLIIAGILGYFGSGFLAAVLMMRLEERKFYREKGYWRSKRRDPFDTVVPCMLFGPLSLLVWIGMVAADRFSRRKRRGALWDFVFQPAAMRKAKAE